MSTINRIQEALGQIDPGKFQKLCDLYLTYKGYGNLTALGSVTGKDKVKTGTPDSHGKQKNGKYMFAEYTTVADNVPQKIADDLAKCLDQEKTGIPITEIEEIVFCHNSKLTTGEENKLYGDAKKAGVKIRIIGLDAISFEIYTNHPNLARDILNIEIDTGQILPPAEFVEIYDKNQLTTPLATEFYFRDKEIEQVLSQLAKDNLILISGPAGTGKTRIALRALELFKTQNPEYEIKCILNRGDSLSNDLKTYFSKSGKFLILVDDANRISGFDHIVYMLMNLKAGQEIKVIATVRDYALDKVRHIAEQRGKTTQIVIEPFSQTELSTILQENFKISNSAWLERIWDISQGNPRLAIMAAKTALEKNDLRGIRNVSELYDQYFSNIRKGLEKLGDKNVLKVAGVISFFRTVDRSNDILMSSIQEIFKIEPKVFWDSAKILHEYELVDIHGDDVVKISDQVLSTYLFYLCVFKNQVLTFEVILDNFFPDQINKIREAFYPCMNAFDADQLISIISLAILNHWEKHKKDKDKKTYIS